MPPEFTLQKNSVAALKYRPRLLRFEYAAIGFSILGNRWARKEFKRLGERRIRQVISEQLLRIERQPLRRQGRAAKESSAPAVEHVKQVQVRRQSELITAISTLPDEWRLIIIVNLLAPGPEETEFQRVEYPVKFLFAFDANLLDIVRGVVAREPREMAPRVSRVSEWCDIAIGG